MVAPDRALSELSFAVSQFDPMRIDRLRLSQVVDLIRAEGRRFNNAVVVGQILSVQFPDEISDALFSTAKREIISEWEEGLDMQHTRPTDYDLIVALSPQQPLFNPGPPVAI